MTHELKSESDTPSAASQRALRRKQALGLLWLALFAMLFAAWRAGFHAIFLPRWWHLW